MHSSSFKELLSPKVKEAKEKIYKAFVVFSMATLILNMSVVGVFFVFNPKPVVAIEQQLFYSGMEESTFADWGYRSTKWQQNGSDHACENKSAAVKKTDGDADIITFGINTTGYIGLKLSFSYKIAQSLEPNDHVYVQWSSDGTTWTTLHHYTNQSTGNWKVASSSLPSSAENKTDLKIRFRANLDSNRDEFLLDCVKLTGSLNCTDNDDDGYAIEGGACGSVDCNDNNPDSWRIDSFWYDGDSDGYHGIYSTSGPDGKISICYGQDIPEGYSDKTEGVDCNDENNAVNPGAKEICDGLDNDCDQDVDEDLTPPAASNQNGVCSGATQICTGSGGWVDDYSNIPYYEEEEGSCDGYDNDCDGSTDEGYNVGATCTVGVGACAAEGFYTCAAAFDGTVCDAVPGNPTEEICGDGIDNNCDGSVDETCECTTSETMPCGQTDVGACQMGQKTCTENGVWGECFGAVYPTEEICGNGIDEDCNGRDLACPKPVTVSASKIVCDDEKYLPDWSGDSVTIGKDTAKNYVNNINKKYKKNVCHLESGWVFQWTNKGLANPGNNLGEVDSWNSTDPTDSNGKTTFTVDSTKDIYVREAMKPGYLNFSGKMGGGTSKSAEMWCYNDVENYDNYDFIRSPKRGKNYYCLAFNVQTSQADGVISGMKVNDKNGDQNQSDDEEFLSGWEMQLKDAAGGLLATATTDETGEYRFTGLTAGVYEVCEVMQSGWINTSPMCAQVELTESNMNQGPDFFNRQLEEGEETGTITVCKYDDQENNGQPELLVGECNSEQSPADYAVYKNGFYWAWASPCSGGCSTVEPIKVPGWRFATEQEWASRPDVADFGTPDSFKCAASHFDYTYLHCDYSDAASGYLSRIPNGEHHETWLIYDCSAQRDDLLISKASAIWNSLIDFVTPKSALAIFMLGNPLSGWTINLNATDESGYSNSKVTGESGCVEFTVPYGSYRIAEVMQTNWSQVTPGGDGYYDVTVNSDNKTPTFFFVNHYTQPEEPILGCTDPTALNYNQGATQDDGSCQYSQGGGGSVGDSSTTSYGGSVFESTASGSTPPQVVVKGEEGAPSFESYQSDNF